MKSSLKAYKDGPLKDRTNILYEVVFFGKKMYYKTRNAEYVINIRNREKVNMIRQIDKKHINITYKKLHDDIYTGMFEVMELIETKRIVNK